MSSLRLIQVPSGDDLLPSLATAPAGSWVQGTGHLEAVEVKLAGEATDPTRALRGRFTLTSLLGPAGGPFTVTLARASDTGLEQVGGVLQKARSLGVTLAVFVPIEAAREPAARREVLAVSAPPATQAVSPASPSGPPAAPPPAAPAEPTRTWADVAAASEIAADEAPWGDGERFPKQGDLIDHFSFGLCEVLKSDGDRLHIRDTKGPGRIREVAIAMLKVMPPTAQNGKRLFRLLRRT
jgi:hypothetical protein